MAGGLVFRGGNCIRSDRRKPLALHVMISGAHYSGFGPTELVPPRPSPYLLSLQSLHAHLVMCCRSQPRVPFGACSNLFIRRQYPKLDLFSECRGRTGISDVYGRHRGIFLAADAKLLSLDARRVCFEERKLDWQIERRPKRIGVVGGGSFPRQGALLLFLTFLKSVVCSRCCGAAGRM